MSPYNLSHVMFCSAQDEVNGFNCSCAAGFTNRDCTINIDDCVMNQCENGGTCKVCAHLLQQLTITQCPLTVVTCVCSLHTGWNSILHL